jgi:hypothetical protein
MLGFSLPMKQLLQSLAVLHRRPCRRPLL